MSRRPELPPKVEAHVQRQLERADWDRLLRDLRTMCADCPADRDPDICVNCPLEGIAIDAATLTLRAQIAKMRKSQTGKKAKQKILTDLKSGTPKK
jgi:hypothetical protein